MSKREGHVIIHSGINAPIYYSPLIFLSSYLLILYSGLKKKTNIYIYI